MPECQWSLMGRHELSFFDLLSLLIFFFFYSERRGSVLRSLVFLSLEFDDLFPFNLQSLFLLQWLFALARHDINY